jgi:hypothetical protein
MIVKTRISNPTDSKQRYSWVPKYGMILGPKQSVVIDGDIYTLTGPTLKNRKCIEEDMRTARVQITLLTDLPVSNEVEEAKVVPTCPPAEQKEVLGETPVAEIPKKWRDAKKEKSNMLEKPVNAFESPMEDPEQNILGKGLVLGGIEESRPQGFDLRGEVLEEKKVEVVEVSALWDEPAEDLITETELDELMGASSEPPAIPAAPSREDLEKMSKKQLLEYATTLNLHVDASKRKAEILQAIVDYLKL